MAARGGGHAARVLTVNAGSTSLKLHLVDGGEAERVDDLAAADAVGHRIVHGGPRLVAPAVVDDEVVAQIEAVTPLAPLHNAPALDALRRARAELPGVPHVAVFDTAFHATIPPEAATYAVPQLWRDEWGIRRYGFHGLSVEWSARRVRVPRLVVCHLGGGCSVTAVRDGRSVDTTMGFSPLEGVPMATRAGSIDPEIVLHLLRARKLGIEEIEEALESESGLVGLSGESSRVEELERSASAGAELALSVFAHRVAGAVAAMAAALGGLDAIVFTGGVGEQSSRVRAGVCVRLEFLGCVLDEAANEAAVPDAVVSVAGAAVAVHVVGAREDVVAADAARAVLRETRTG